MNKILIATTLALVASTPFALAEGAPIPATPTAMHCENVQYNFSQDRAAFKSEAAFQLAQQKAMSLCRQNKEPRGQGAPGTLLMQAG